MEQFICNIRDGRLVVDDGELGSHLKGCDGKYLVTLNRVSDKITPAQRGYYFAAVVADAAEYFGWEKEEMHDWLKDQCNKKELINKRTGEISFIASTTTVLDKMEKSSYIDRCIRRLAQEGFVVRTSEEYFRDIELNEPIIIHE